MDVLKSKNIIQKYFNEEFLSQSQDLPILIIQTFCQNNELSIDDDLFKISENIIKKNWNSLNTVNQCKIQSFYLYFEIDYTRFLDEFEELTHLILKYDN